MAEAETLPSSIGRHFQVQACIGAGGTSRVLHVIDQRNGQHLALKQARSPVSERRARSQALFRQEFHVLSRIVHPNVVRAFEYGFADDRPFYTMELLRGRALSELAPLSWQRLCAVLLDLCSPLSMLHARRFVHCDVTARNVLVTERGETKLIDFGALTAIDRPVLTIAGTPPHMAPELVQRQAIDGRVDMFAIGALAYNMLTGQHAYPAHTIQELQQVWKIVPPSVRERGFAIPAALDALIMSLLSLDASARPLQLAELVHRLSAIVDTAYALDSASLQAQLATPDLVGRRDALEQFRAAQRLAAAGCGAVMCYAGVKGIGRSRMLESCALDAIQAGCLVIHVTPEQAPKQAFGLLAQIFMAAHAQDAELAGRLPFEAGSVQLAEALSSQPEASLRALWRALCAKRPAIVLIDDITCADAASMRHCLGLSDLARELPLLVVTAIETGALSVDVTQLLAAGRTLVLRPLTEPE
ncbi:MAG TPA: serine/threonine-protein kinase, partial [Polyangiales bacterium]|nr:serine/threonine-protein kinase [Polyangiales bacterium]